jgi:hypothetical protein
MIPKELAEQMRSEVQRLKEVGDEFLHTWKELCAHFGGPSWHRAEIEMVFHRVRKEVIPIMEQAGMEPGAVQALCAWAEKVVMHR